MIVISVISILATLGLVGFRSAQESARDTQRMNNVRGLQMALECYFAERRYYPVDITDWTDLGEDLGRCWTGGRSFSNRPEGDTMLVGGEFFRAGVKNGQYVYSRIEDGDGYQIILQGENRTLTVKSPS